MSKQINPDDYRSQLGQVRTYEFGPISQQQVRRFARSIEDDNPLFHDLAYARDAGYDNLVVPPNYLPAIIDYSEGKSAEELRGDGLDDERFFIDLPSEAILMGGGQSISFSRYITAGESFTIKETFKDVYQKEGSLGLLTFQESTINCYDDEGSLSIECEATMIIGDRQ